MKKSLIFGIVLILFFNIAAIQLDESSLLLVEPDVQKAIENGYGTELNLTDSPIIAESPLKKVSDLTNNHRKILPVEKSITLDGVTVTLDWIYKEVGAIVLMSSFKNLPDGTVPAVPSFTYDRVYLIEGASLPENKTVKFQDNQLLAVSYEVANPKNADRKINIGIDVPLVQESDLFGEPVDVFHFEIPDYEVPNGQVISWQQTSSVTINGVEVQQRLVRMTPKEIKTMICYDVPEGVTDWRIQEAALHLNSEPLSPMIASEELPDPQNLKKQCEWLTFERGKIPYETFDMLKLQIGRIGSAADPESGYKSDWEFYSVPPVDPLFPDLFVSAAQPAETEPNPQEVRMMLDWGYADEKQLALGYTIEGLLYTPEATFLAGSMTIVNSEGETIPVYQMSRNLWSSSKDGTLKGYWEFRSELSQISLGTPPYQIQFVLDGSNVSQNSQTGWIGSIESTESYAGYPVPVPQSMVGAFNFIVDLPVYPIETGAPDQTVVVNGLEMRLIRAEMTNASTAILLCYQKPSDKDWMLVGYGINNPVLETGGEQLPARGYNLVYDEMIGGWMQGSPNRLTPKIDVKKGERCASITFPGGRTSDEPQRFRLVIPRLTQSRPEVIKNEDIEAIREPLEKIGITFNYETSRSSGGGGGGFEILTLPKEMSQENAFLEIDRALGFFAEGPWIFEFEMP